MVTELRNFGADNLIVLYTDNQQLYSALKSLKRLDHEIRYYNDEKLVGVDLYFHKKYKSWLEGKIGTVGASVR